MIQYVLSSFRKSLVASACVLTIIIEHKQQEKKKNNEEKSLKHFSEKFDWINNNNKNHTI